MAKTENFKVILGEYKGLTSQKPPVELTEEEFEEVCVQQRKLFSQKIEVNRPVKNGDIAVIDFIGYCDGKTFDGGDGEDYPLEIGSGTFIPGFEEQLIGVKRGKRTDVNVVFPENYPVPELAGKPAVFKVTVNRIEEVHVPDMDDNVKADIRAKLMEKKEQEAESFYENSLVGEVIQNSDIEIEDVFVTLEAGNMVDEWKLMLKSNGLDPEEYYQKTGMDDGAMTEQLKPQALLRMQSRLVLDAVAQAEGIDVSEADLENEKDKMVIQYEVTRAELDERLNEEHIRAITSDIRRRKTIDFMKAHAASGKEIE